MAYVVANYFVGPLCSYDGTGNTDKATITLFKEKETAIQYIISEIQSEIDDQSDIDDDHKDTKPKFDDEENLRKDLKKYNFYTFQETYMFTLEYLPIN